MPDRIHKIHKRHWDLDDTIGVIETLILILILFWFGMRSN